MEEKKQQAASHEPQLERLRHYALEKVTELKPKIAENFGSRVTGEDWQYLGEFLAYLDILTEIDPTTKIVES